MIIWLIFFLFLQTKPCFFHLFAWSQLDFSALPVLISAVSLRRLTTYVLLDFKVAKWAVSSLTHWSNPYQVNMFISKFMIQICIIFKMYRKGKDIIKKRHKIFLIFLIYLVTNLSSPFVFVFSAFGEKFPTAEFRMISAETPCWEIERKFWMRSFTCRSTCLYAWWSM